MFGLSIAILRDGFTGASGALAGYPNRSRKEPETSMNQTVLITGTSSGYGKATAELFLDRGWNVVATMRQPKPDIFGSQSDRLKVLALDVTDSGSVNKAIAEAISTFGTIDVLVNNAGIGIVGAFEATPIATVREVFETNTFGVMAMTHAVLPLFRELRCGVVVNVTSSVTLARMPLAAAYTASKAAIEGFTGSLAFEAEWFNVRVKLVEPGYAPSTRFASNGASRMQGLIPEAYAPFAESIFAGFAQPTAVTTESDVAEAIWRAANDTTGQLRFPAGADALALAQSR
jgi:NAD(P)-dependent dehydrogenase (short-subunit alcohol dehydrogenase family)